MNDYVLVQMILVERIPKVHRSWHPISNDLKNSLAGAGGESRTLALLKRELDLEEAPIFLADLSVPYKDGFAQIDILLLHKAFICVLEVKNMKGEFFFDSANFQFHRMMEGRMEGMRNPESQLHRAVKAVGKFLDVPVQGVMVLASRSGRVVEGPKKYPIVSMDYLPFHLEELAHSENFFDCRSLEHKLKSLPKKSFQKNLLERHQITVDSIRLGVTCPECRNRSLERASRKWHCTGCGGFFKDAHEVTLQEYAVLFGEELPTHFAYRLLGVEDKYLLYRLLENSALQGNERGKRWVVPRRELLQTYFGRIYR
ncbi:nuclease-related domain-containing protein [Planococcus sp. 1R117A]|uniref:nuclease-related domain-containing protein n=1 Tax=Planococcus sp. 1R117A TaxID=3447020 RepID=UPI003EDBE96F